MRKWIKVVYPLIMIFILTSSRFGTPFKASVPDHLLTSTSEVVVFPVHEFYETELNTLPPFVGRSYVGFKEALAFKESQGNYSSINTFGYLGKYQFGLGTLRLMGVSNANRFLSDPSLQEKVFKTNIARNKWILRRDIKRFVGKKINGVTITESGIVAAAHLAGAGNVKKYLRSYGTVNVADAYGSSIAYYMKRFSGYDLSLIQAKRNARAV